MMPAVSVQQGCTKRDTSIPFYSCDTCSELKRGEKRQHGGGGRWGKREERWKQGRNAFAIQTAVDRGGWGISK